MADTDQQTGTVETRAEYERSPTEFVRHWLQAIEQAGKGKEADWRKDAEETIKRYRSEMGRKDYNILYSNIETTVPSLYNSEPLPDVRRRFGDDDPIGKAVATLIERAITIQCELYDFDACMQAAVKDRQLAGRGVTRMRLGMGQNGSKWITCENVQYDDFRIGPAKRWEDVPWVSFEWKYTREELVALSPELGAKVELDATTSESPDKDSKEDVPDMFKRATVYEIWEKSSRKVYFIAKSFSDGPIKVEDDPYELREFFPVPKPLYAVKTSDSLVPVCEFKIWKPLADEIDTLTSRIKAIVKVIKWRGIYGGGDEQAIAALSKLDDGDLAPAPDAARMMTQGGIDKAIWLMPIEQAAKTVEALYLAREQAKQALYEQTGIADIMRGSSDAQETLGAQQLKAQWGSLRIQVGQKDVQRYARDLFRMMADLLGRFEFEELMAMTGAPLPQPPAQPPQMGHNGGPPMEGQPQGQPPVPPEVMQAQAQQQAMLWQQQAVEKMKALLQNDLQREFMIDIETDSTIRADLTRDQQNAAGFVQGFASYTQAVGPAIQAGIMPAEVAVKMAIGFTRLFKLGRQVELALEQWGKMAEQQAANPPPKPPTPEELKMQEMQASQAMEEKRLQMDAMAGQQKMAMEKQTNDQKLAFEAQKHEQEMAFKAREHEQNIQLQREQSQQQLRQQDLHHSEQMTDARLSRVHEADEKQRDRDHQSRMADGEQRNARRIARMKPQAAGETESEQMEAELDEATPDQGNGLVEGIKALADAVAQQGQAIVKQGEDMKEGFGVLARATLAETELVRGPDGRAAGTRKRPMVN